MKAPPRYIVSGTEYIGEPTKVYAHGLDTLGTGPSVWTKVRFRATQYSEDMADKIHHSKKFKWIKDRKMEPV